MTATLARDEPEVADPAYRAARFRDAVRSEATKARTVPSTRWTVIAAAVLGVGLGALISALASHGYANDSASTKALWDPTSISGAGLDFAQLAIGVLGVLIITSEYSTGAIRSSLAAVPRHGRLLAAKAMVIAVLTFVAVEVIAFVAFFVGQAIMSGSAPTAALGDPHVLRALIGSGIYGAALALLGLALGTLLRSAAGAISLLVALLFVLPGVAAALPSSIEHVVEKYWPTEAGGQISVVVRTAHTLSAWAGLGVFLLFVAIVGSAAVYVMNRRDA